MSRSLQFVSYECRMCDYYWYCWSSGNKYRPRTCDYTLVVHALLLFVVLTLYSWCCEVVMVVCCSFMVVVVVIVAVVLYVVVIVFATWLGCSEFIPQHGRNIRVVVCSGAPPSENGILLDR